MWVSAPDLHPPHLLSSIFKTNNIQFLWLGGLDEQVNEVFLLNAFVPFGDIVQVQIPKDPTSGEPPPASFPCLLSD